MAHECKLHSNYGPGGRDCNCCGPAPSLRKKHDRMVKRRVRQIVKEEIKEQIVEKNDE